MFTVNTLPKFCVKNANAKNCHAIDVKKSPVNVTHYRTDVLLNITMVSRNRCFAHTQSVPFSKLCIFGVIRLGLEHQLHKFFVVDFTVPVGVCFFDHVRDLLVRQMFSEIDEYLSEFLGSDRPAAIRIEHPEGVHHFFLGVVVAFLQGHHLDEFREIDDSVSVLVRL